MILAEVSNEVLTIFFSSNFNIKHLMLAFPDAVMDSMNTGYQDQSESKAAAAKVPVPNSQARPSSVRNNPGKANGSR
jgi:hypothetical protein